MRTKLIAGNWKMNNTPSQGVALINEIKETANAASCDVVVCTPYICLPAAVQAANGSKIAVSAENMHFEDKGAFTGEISAAMLKEVGVTYTVIGHSERREYFAETDKTVNLKTIKALENDIVPIVCVGESLEQRESGVAFDFIAMQVKLALNGISAEDAKKVVIAYEPIWAIGTGKTATDEQANEVCAFIRQQITALYGTDVADTMRILYGGSMNAGNAAGLLAQSDIDGGLIGGASLKAPDFCTIINAATNA
ncbi:MAG: triose-phosphate isomerase [Clostridia bacterium]|nr:triose-phosphate isomerase [Clostridia bacterium]